MGLGLRVTWTLQGSSFLRFGMAFGLGLLFEMPKGITLESLGRI